MRVEEKFSTLEKRISIAAKVVHVLADHLGDPAEGRAITGGYQHRFADPGLAHFCLLKGMRAVSAVNAALCLARQGYSQETCVLLRVMIECTTQIEYVLVGTLTAGQATPEAIRYVSEYFADSERGTGTPAKKAKVPQATVHRAIVGDTNLLLEMLTGELPDSDLLKMLFKSYEQLSNFVHARYPEIMNMFVERPDLELYGSNADWRKDDLAGIIDIYLVTTANALKMMILSLKLRHLLDGDPLLRPWLIEKSEELFQE